jgi:hypothetical protein
VPEVGLELHSGPCNHWAPAETCGIRPDPTPIGPSPTAKVCTLCTPPKSPFRALQNKNRVPTVGTRFVFALVALRTGSPVQNSGWQGHARAGRPANSDYLHGGDRLLHSSHESFDNSEHDPDQNFCKAALLLNAIGTPLQLGRGVRYRTSPNCAASVRSRDGQSAADTDNPDRDSRQDKANS